MAVIRKVTRVSNPRGRRKYKRNRSTSRNAKGRFVKISKVRNKRRTKNGARRKKNISLSSLGTQIKRLKASLTGGSTRRKRHSRKRRTRVTRKRNPVLIELGSMVNPKRRKNVAKTRKRRKSRNPRRHATAKVTTRRRRRYTRRRRRNPAPALKVYRRRRRTVNSRRRRVHHRRRRNPAVFGRSGGKDLLMMVGGGLVGVAATKYLPTLLPASITSTISGATGSFFPVIITGAGAFAAGFLAKKFLGGALGQAFGDAVLFGGLMQTGSAALNAFFPSASILGQRLALSGVGDIIPGQFVVPQNPFKYSIAPAGGNGMGNLRRFGTFR